MAARDTSTYTTITTPILMKIALGTFFLALSIFSEALVTTNGQPVQRTVLRNGDTVEIGALRLQFWLGDVPRRSLRVSEWFVWAIIAAISLGQVALVYWLPR